VIFVKIATVDIAIKLPTQAKIIAWILALGGSLTPSPLNLEK
jgi:hypothetical protein